MMNLEHIFSYLQYAPLATLAAAVLGYLVGLVRKGRRGAAKETAGNIGIWLVDTALKATLTGDTMLLVLRPFAHLAPLQLPVTCATFGLTLVLADFIYYWKHRYAHEVRFLWATHAVHHSSNEYDLSTALRLPWFGAAIDALFYAPIVFLGVRPELVFLAKITILLYQFSLHTKAVGRLGWLELVLNTPSSHRVHHGSNAVYIDKNHGGILIVWDRLFGTYQAELANEPVVYGLTTPLISNNPLRINAYEPLRLARDVMRARSARVAFLHLFKGPGWTPNLTDRSTAAPSHSFPRVS